MKKVIYLLVALLSGGFVQAQESEEEKEPFSINTSAGGSRDRLILELNWNTWINTPDSLNVQGKSRGFNFYFFYDIRLGTDNVSLAPGFGLANSNIFHESFLNVNIDTLSPNFGNTEIAPFASNLDYKKNKISLTYLEIPVELRFRTNPNSKGKHFKVAAGFKGGLLINSHTKYVGTDTRATALPGNTDYVKYKEARIMNLESYRYGVTGRIGYGAVNLHAFYGLSNVFQAGQGPEAQTLEIGLSINSF
jgi:hypothetical protein